MEAISNYRMYTLILSDLFFYSNCKSSLSFNQINLWAANVSLLQYCPDEYIFIETILIKTRLIKIIWVNYSKILCLIFFTLPIIVLNVFLILKKIEI